jgi:hypothetical protein
MTSPATVEELQYYLKDESSDGDLLDYFQSLLYTATQFVYTYLDREYTPSTSFTEIFWGDDGNAVRLRHRAGAITSWKYYDEAGNETIEDSIDLGLREDGNLIIAGTKRFLAGYEHRIVYTLPGSLVCPEPIKQCVIELAAMLFNKSNQGHGTLSTLDLEPHQLAVLRMYKRVAV